MRKVSYILLTLALLLMAAPQGFAANAGKPASQPVAAAPVAPAAPAAAPKAAPTPAPAAAPEKAAKSAPAAPAKTEVKQKWWQGILVTVIEAVLAIATPVLVILITGLLRKMKLNVEKEKVAWAVEQGRGFGEQQIKLALKDGKTPDYEGVKKKSVELSHSILIEGGLAAKWGHMLGDLLEAKLGMDEIDKKKAPKE